MVVSFTPPDEVPGGYITLIRAFVSSYPEDVPMYGESYHIGEVIGSSSVVVGIGPSTSLSIESLLPGTEYFFNVYAYNLLDDGGRIRLNPDGPLIGSVTTSLMDPIARHISPYPNPFTEEIKIPFTVSDDNTFVQIDIIDMMGNKVADVTNQTFDQGNHEVIWNGINSQGSKVQQGVYVYCVRMRESGQSMRGTVVAR